MTLSRRSVDRHTPQVIMEEQTSTPSHNDRTISSPQSNDQPTKPDNSQVNKIVFILSICIVVGVVLLAVYEIAYLIGDFVVLIVWAAKGNTAYFLFARLVPPIALHLVSCFFFIVICALGIISVLPMLQKSMQLIFSIVFICCLVLITVVQLILLIVIVALADFGGIFIDVPVRAGYGWSFTLTIILPTGITILSITRIILLHLKPNV